MKEKKSNTKDWLNTGVKKEVFVTMYIIYQLGYGIGTFLAYIGL